MTRESIVFKFFHGVSLDDANKKQPTSKYSTTNMDVTIYLEIISSKRTPIPAKWKRFKLKWNDVKKKNEKT